MTVLGELFFAVEASRRKEKNLASMEAFLGSAIVWEFDRPAAEEFGRVQAEQKRKGRPIPATDAHFDTITDLTTEHWLQRA